MRTISLVFAVALVAVLAGGNVALARPSRLPMGSYQRSCSKIRFDGRTLTATCLNKRGMPVRTSLANPHRCRRDIANINGTLMCH